MHFYCLQNVKSIILHSLAFGSYMGDLQLSPVQRSQIYCNASHIVNMYIYIYIHVYYIYPGDYSPIDALFPLSSFVKFTFTLFIAAL